MTPGYRTGTATGSGRESARSLHWLTLAAVLVILLSAVAPGVWTHGAGVARAQDEVAAGDVTPPGQVIAQGIARLPRGDLAWTVRTVTVTGDERTTVASFPVGFVVADGATIAVLDEQGDVLNLLEDGEAAFLPNGKAGALASWDDEASLYEVALVSAEEASAGETPGTVAGNPFAAPKGTTFDIEIARTVLARDDQTTIPISPSGAPVLYLQTAGAAQLQAGESQPVELAAGQFAMLLGDVTARGASDEPATFLVAAIGEETAERDATEGTPEARAGREESSASPRCGDRERRRGARQASKTSPHRRWRWPGQPDSTAGHGRHWGRSSQRRGHATTPDRSPGRHTAGGAHGRSNAPGGDGGSR